MRILFGCCWAMPLGRICISHEQQMIVTTALLIVDHVFESRLYDRFLGPS